jgi:ketosteroid isomerase-like protein
MTKLVLFACAAAIATVGLGQDLRTQSSDEREIRALQGRLAAAVSGRDLDAVMKEYVPGNELFVFDSDLPRQHVGWASYKKDWWEFLGSAVDVAVEVRDLGITVEGKAAFSHNLEHITWKKKQDGSRGEMLLSVTDAYRKIDGKWLIVMEHWSIPVKDGKAVFMAEP